MKKDRILVGIGGWTYAPWRETFYPADLPHTRELEYASRQVSAIEINGTYYATQKPASFAKWHDAVPENFVFSVKASRYATNRKILADAGASIERFIGSGLVELGSKLGPLVWQFAPTKVFEPSDFEAFLKLLPTQVEGLKLRHVLDVRHASFMSPEFLDLTRKYKTATVFTDAERYPSFADLSSDFVYARLMRSDADLTTGYTASALAIWAKRVRIWAEGKHPSDLPCIEAERMKKATRPREVFVFFINGAKERAPAAACALLRNLASMD